MAPDDAETRVRRAFEEGFRELFLEDIKKANASDVRMGTFTLCAAFLDALSLTYSAGIKVQQGDAGKWARFFEQFFGERYRAIWNSYRDFRCLLLHNFAPSERLGFVSGELDARFHLTVRDGRLLLHRESFVADVERAFVDLYQAVRNDTGLQSRVLDHFDRYSPMGIVKWPIGNAPRPFGPVEHLTYRANIAATALSGTGSSSDGSDY